MLLHETLLHILSITNLTKRKANDIKKEIGQLEKYAMAEDGSIESADDEVREIFLQR